MTHLATTVASLAHTSAGDLGDWTSQRLVQTGRVPLPVAVSALDFPIRSVMVEAALVALRQASRILL